jgi:hypothetical protein
MAALTDAGSPHRHGTRIGRVTVSWRCAKLRRAASSLGLGWDPREVLEALGGTEAG